MNKLDHTGRIKPILAALIGLVGYLAITMLVGLFFMILDGKSCTMQYFWTIDSDIPSEFITRNFSPTHITWLITSLIMIAFVLQVYRRQSSAVKTRILQFLAIFMVVSEIVDWSWYIIIGHYSLRNTLPLHLCAMSIFLEAAAVLGKRRILLKEFVYALSLPAAFAALVTPGWYYPIISFQYLQSALAHSLLILIPVLIVWGDGFRPNYRRLPQCFLLLLFLAGIAATANTLFDSNYMFLGYVPKDTTLQVFERWLGHPGYIFLEIALILIIWVILYLPWIAADRKRHRDMTPKSEKG